jgi:predicted XRE-type DNA-binding protein
MDKSILAMLFVTTVVFILAIVFIWINNRFNNYEEFNELDEEALVKLEMKKQLMQELHRWIKGNNLNATQIQELLMVNPKRAADIIYQRIDQFTVDSLTNYVLRTGKTVSVSIHEK